MPFSEWRWRKWIVTVTLGVTQHPGRKTPSALLAGPSAHPPAAGSSCRMCRMSPACSSLHVAPGPRARCVFPMPSGPGCAPPTLCVAPKEQPTHPQPPETASAGLAAAGRLGQCCPSPQLSLSPALLQQGAFSCLYATESDFETKHFYSNPGLC